MISGECKTGVVDVQYEDGSLDTSSTRTKMNKAITSTNKSQKVVIALIQTHKNYKLANVCLITSSKNRFEYILYSFKSLPLNKDAIEYMYGPMPGVVNDIKT